MKCADCKHWDTKPGWLETAAAKYRDQRECLHPSLKATPYGEGVVMEGITTAADFGCVQFEAK